MTLDALIRTAASLLRPHGQLALVHRTNRLTDVMTALRFHRIEPKSLLLVQSVESRPPSRFLLSAVNQARPGSLVVEPPLIVRDGNRHMTPELVRIYGNTSHMSPEALYDGLTETSIPWQPTHAMSEKK